MTLKREKLTLDKQTVRSLRARSSIRAGVGEPVDSNGALSGFNKCIPIDPDPVVAPGAGGLAARKPGVDPVFIPSKAN